MQTPQGPKVIPEDVLFKTHYGNYSRSSYSYKWLILTMQLVYKFYFSSLACNLSLQILQ